MQPSMLSTEATTAEDAVVQLLMTVGRRFRARADGDTVDPSQAALLYVLKCHGAMRLGDIAETMKLDASTVSRHVQQLGEHGFIDRDPDPQDGRASIIALSDAGAVSLKHAFDQRRAVLAAALVDWDDASREQLRLDLTRLTNSLGEHA